MAIKPIFFLTLLLLVTTTAKAQTKPLKFQILNEATSAGLPYATVELRDDTTSMVKAQTDAAGYFYLDSNLITGKTNLKLIIRFITYTSSAIDFTENSRLYQIVIPNQLIEEVTIVAQRKLLHIQNNKITYDLFRDSLNNRGNTANAMLQIPGLDISITGDVKAGTKNILYMLNGMENPLVSSGKALKSLPARLISKIEMITDPDPVYRERGYDLILNFISKADIIEGSLGNTVVALDSRKGYSGEASFYYRKNNFSVSVNTDLSTTKSTFTEQTDIMSQGNRQSQISSASFENNRNANSLELNYALKKTLLYVYGNYNSYANIQNGNSLYEDLMDKQAVTGMLKMQNETFVTGAGIRFNHPKTNGTANISYSNFPSISRIINTVLAADSVNSGLNSTKRNETVIQGTFTTKLNAKLSFDYGYQGIYRHYGTLNHTTYTRSNTEHTLAEDASAYNQHINALFFYTKINPSPKLQLSAGLRAEYSVLNSLVNTTELFDKHYLNFLPRVNLSFQTAKTQVLTFSYLMHLKRPPIEYITPFVNSSNAVVHTTGNPDLKPEFFQSFTLGYTFYIGKFSIRPQFYHSFSNNSIQKITAKSDDKTFLESYVNGGKTNHKIFYFGFGGALTKRINFNVNSGVGESMVKLNNLTSRHFFYTVSFSNSYNLGKGFRGFLSGFLNSPTVQPQGYASGTNLYSAGFSKSFHNDKSILSISSSNFILKDRNTVREIHDEGYALIAKKSEVARLITFSWVYTFGKLKEGNVKRGGRTSVNDIKTN